MATTGSDQSRAAKSRQPKVEQKVEIPKPAAERTTVEMPVPQEFRIDEPAPLEDLGVADLGEFAEGTDFTGEPTTKEIPAAIPVPPQEQQERADDVFAAELDALFAAADTAKQSSGELDIGLPSDFDLTDLSATRRSKRASSCPAKISRLATTQRSMNCTTSSRRFSISSTSPPPTCPKPTIRLNFKPAVRPTPEQKKAAEPVLPPDWSLDDLGPESDTADETSAAPFGVEKMSTTEYLAPDVDEGSVKQKATLPTADGGLSLELVPMEEAVAPQNQPSNYESEAWLDGSRPAEKIKVPGAAPATAGVQKVFVLGASIGGPEAVRDFLGALPAGFPVLFILAQHMGEEFLELMSAQLRKSIAMTVRNPTHGERVGHGEVLIVPTTHRLQVDRDGVVTLAHLPEKPPYSPSIDLVLRDVADQFEADGGAIIFSGMAHDAVEGSKYLKEKGGTVWVQDPDTCVISSMVDGAREAGVVTFIGSPAQLATKMISDFGNG